MLTPRVLSMLWTFISLFDVKMCTEEQCLDKDEHSFLSANENFAEINVSFLNILRF